jgi:flagellar biosynthesis anti-sigma factor FlgM
MMKIQGNSPNQEASATTRLEQTRPERQGKADRSGDAGTDRVELSSDAQLASSAVRAATDAPSIRKGVVEQARQKLLAGEIGQDPLKLADRLIDHLLER